MKKFSIIIIAVIATLSSIGCSSNILGDIERSLEEGIEAMEGTESVEITATEIIVTEEMLEEEEESEVLGLALEDETEVDGWGAASLEFFELYMEEPTNFEDDEVYYHIICYMLLNHLETYSFRIDNPDYGVETAEEILAVDVLEAYNEVSLFLNTYTDFWSRFSASCAQMVEEDGGIRYFEYTFVLEQKDGMSSEETMEHLMTAEEACIELVDTLFEEGELTSEMTDKEKAYVLYRWIGEHVEYAYDSPDVDSDEVKPDTCYDAVVDDYAVCQGITGAYVQLCRLAGVDMYVQLGYTNDGAHSWCKMEDGNGTWIYIDPTWGITGAKDDEVCTDTWFWVTQEFMEEYSGNGRAFTEYDE